MLGTPVIFIFGYITDYITRHQVILIIYHREHLQPLSFTSLKILLLLQAQLKSRSSLISRLLLWLLEFKILYSIYYLELLAHYNIHLVHDYVSNLIIINIITPKQLYEFGKYLYFSIYKLKCYTKLNKFYKLNYNLKLRIS